MKILLQIALLSLALFTITHQIDWSILQGDKLFNSNTPIISIWKEDENLEKDTSVDLICVIDISGSMHGEKIELVKNSLLTLVDLMNTSDRLGLILFNDVAIELAELMDMAPVNKIIVKKKIESIKANGSTSILNGLKKAVEMWSAIQKPSDVSAVILLSDGNDSYNSADDLADGWRDLTKEKKLNFVLHTFGYGFDHDPKIMQKLAKLRDGSFFFVEEFAKIKAMFVSVLGGCMSVISNKVKISVESKYKWEKVFGLAEFNTYVSNDYNFETELMQFISGKEYTYSFEVAIPDDIEYGTQILDITIEYVDLEGHVNTISQKLIHEKRKNSAESKKFLEKANKEYIRCTTYDKMQEASEWKEKNEVDAAKKVLTEMTGWIDSNTEQFPDTEVYRKDLSTSLEYMEDSEKYEQSGVAYMKSRIREGSIQYDGPSMEHMNSRQNQLWAMID